VSYDPNPSYPVAGAEPMNGYANPAAELAARGPCVVALDGPAALAWDEVVARLREALRAHVATSYVLDIRASFLPWDEIRRRTAGSEPRDDPVFGRIFEGALTDFFDGLPRFQPPEQDVMVVFGPGSALVEHDVLWYADLPKRAALAAVRAGAIAATVSQYPYVMGRMAVEACVAAARGARLPARVLAPIAVLSSANVGRAIAAFPTPVDRYADPFGALLRGRK
jgi:hypothetical protein